MRLSQKDRLANELEVLFALRLIEILAPLRGTLSRIGHEDIARNIGGEDIDMSREIRIILNKYDIHHSWEWDAKNVEAIRDELSDFDRCLDNLPEDL